MTLSLRDRIGIRRELEFRNAIGKAQIWFWGSDEDDPDKDCPFVYAVPDRYLWQRIWNLMIGRLMLAGLDRLEQDLGRPGERWD